MLGAVVLVVGLAGTAFQARVNLRANANSVPDVDTLDVGADACGVSNDLVAYYERKLGFAPAGGERMNVAAADTTVGDGNFDVIFGPVLGSELHDLEVGLRAEGSLSN